MSAATNAASPARGRGLNPYGNERRRRLPEWRTLLWALVIAGGCMFLGLVCVVMGDMVAQKPVFFVVLPVALVVVFMFLANPKSLLFTIILLRAIGNPVLEEARFASFGGLGGLMNLAVILLAVVFWMREPRRIPRVAWMVWVPFIAMQAVGLLYSPDRLPELRTFLGTLSTMAMFVVAFYVVDDWTSFDRILKLVIWSSVPVAIYTLIAIARGDVHISNDPAAMGRYKGPFSHPNILAFYLVLMQGVLLYLWKNARTLAHSTTAQRLAMAFYLLILLALLGATKTRSAWMAAGAMFFLYGLLFERRFLLYLLLVPLLALLVPDIRDRVLDIGQGNVVVQYAKLNSFTWRRVLWEDAITWMAPMRYAFGYGSGGFFFNSPTFFSLSGGMTTGAHSVAVQMLFDVGVVGLAAYYWKYWRAAQIFWRFRREDALLSAMFIALLIGYVVVSLSDNMLSYLVFNWFFWFVMGAGCAIVCHEKADIGRRPRRVVRRVARPWAVTEPA
ncbi:MAG: hypothetical protein EOP37_08740 [Rubrivivax sp.]|nr:MAG: hypothetical protein EOP37_08740 [Rubrivivax sp.]